jgi:hypothetical protein
MSTAQPTVNPTVYPATQPLIPIITAVYGFIIIMLMSCGATMYKSNAKREIYFNKKKVLKENYKKEYADLAGNKLATPDGKILADSVEFKELNTRYKTLLEELNQSDFYADIGDHFIAPISESSPSRMLNKIMFHTSVGRIMVNVEDRIENSIVRVLEYVLSLLAYANFQYYVSVSELKSQTLTAQFVVIFIFSVLFQLFCIMKEEYVRSRMGGTLDVIEPVKS